ncbi:MAG: hypothetical protein SO188_12185 [Prevotella sp.]|nr:hypothetical protein [Prevotella sp.]
MNIIFSTIIAIVILLLFAIFAAWIGKFNAKDKLAFIEKTLDRKEAFIDRAIEKVLDKVSTTVTSGIDMAMDQHKTGPWYLVVYTQDSNYPIWISNNTIRSVHPDPANNKIIVKQFNGEDIVIEIVESYELCSGSDMCDYDM